MNKNVFNYSRDFGSRSKGQSKSIRNNPLNKIFSGDEARKRHEERKMLLKRMKSIQDERKGVNENE